MHRSTDSLNAPISKTATILPTSIASGDSKKLTKWGPVMIPDITLHVEFGFQLAPCLHWTSYAPLIISELLKLSEHTRMHFTERRRTRKTPRLANREITYRSWCPTSFLRNFTGIGYGTWRLTLKSRNFRAFSLVWKGGDADLLCQLLLIINIINK